MRKLGFVIFSVAVLLVPALSHANIKTLDGLSADAQFLATTTGATSLHTRILNVGANTHQLQWDGTPWRVDQGGTGAASFTNGGVFFFLNGIFTQNVSTLFWDNVKNALGIGNSSPQHALDVTGAMYSRLVTDSDSANITIDWNQGNVHTLTLNTANTALSFANGQAGGEYKLILKQDSTGGRTVIWPASVQWPNGIAPTLTSSATGKDVVSFVNDSSNYLGSFSLNYQISATSTTAEVLVVAGGGGGGKGNTPSDYSAGGGGGGGYQYNASYVITPQAYVVTVGVGGTGSNSSSVRGSNGGNSVFGSITAIGGGGGGSRITQTTGADGGSGGGGGGGGSTAGGTGSQGNNGGAGSPTNADDAGGGGGGSSTAGANATDFNGGNGGSGTSNSITGFALTYAGGGGGSGLTTAGAGGTGGGGAGSLGLTTAAVAGTINTGGGGGAGADDSHDGANGGSGVVIISYVTGTMSATGGNVTTSGGRTIHTFTSSGTFTVTSI